MVVYRRTRSVSTLKFVRAVGNWTDFGARFMNLGCPERPMQAEEPELDDILPAQDDSWDQGVSCSGILYFSNSSLNCAYLGYGT